MLLLILAVWLIGAEAVQRPAFVYSPALLIFLGGYCLMVMGVAIWARLLSRQVLGEAFRRQMRRFNKFVYYARWTIPAWMLFGLFGGAAWAQNVLAAVGTTLQTPGILVGTLPAFLAWMGLWWAEFPADRAFREQSILGELYEDLPVHAPPGFWRYFVNTLRQQLLPVVLPVLLIVMLRDVLMLGLGRWIPPTWEELLMLPAAALVYLLSPEILRRVFDARTMEESSLRLRLDTICRRAGLRYRDILLWRTDFSVANACVIGILPRWRYVLLSDRLIETMPDEQIEAVFAHELGHIVYHHLLWFIIFFVMLTLAALGPIQMGEDWLAAHLPAALRTADYENIRSVIVGAGTFALMLIAFGMLSRRFEQQADVFAARMMESNWGEGDQDKQTKGQAEKEKDADAPVCLSACPLVPLSCSVGQRGARIFSSALYRVAVVNNIPLDGRDWFHPSIANRLRHLEQLSGDPISARRFDRGMSRLYVVMVLALLMCGGIVVRQWWTGQLQGTDTAQSSAQ
jgi:STE24 endopeptidase